MNPLITIIVQNSLANLFVSEMCDNPCIVDVSKNFLNSPIILGVLKNTTMCS